MKRHRPPPQTFLRCVTTHLRPVSRPRSRPASIQPLCEWRSGPGPRGAAQTAEQTQLLSGPGWVQCDMASSRGPVWDLGQGSSSLCAQSRSSPRARALDHPAMSPPLCSGLSAPHRHSHSVRSCGRKILSWLNPEECREDK